MIPLGAHCTMQTQKRKSFYCAIAIWTRHPIVYLLLLLFIWADCSKSLQNKSLQNTKYIIKKVPFSLSQTHRLFKRLFRLFEIMNGNNNNNKKVVYSYFFFKSVLVLDFVLFNMLLLLFFIFVFLYS